MRIGLAVIMLAAALAARGDALDVRTSQVDNLTGASRVVTNVTFDAEGAFNAISNRADALIKAVAPAPGDYGTVSNRAMSAIQEHQSLWPAVEASTNYTDRALGAFAATGTVARANVYGTPTRWTDASGDVWEELDVWSGDNVSLIRYEANQWRSKDDDSWMSFNNGTWTAGIDASADIFSCTGHEDDTSLTMQGDYGTITLTRGIATNLVGRVALTNDIPAIPAETDPTVPAWAKAQNKPTYTAIEVGATDGEAVTNIVRQMSLGGIYDDKLGVWWTPHMSGGAYYWTATTNVNLAVEGNQ